MKQNFSLLLPIVALLIGFTVVATSILGGNTYQVALGAILVIASIIVFKRNLQAVDTELAQRLKMKLGMADE